MSDCGVKDPNVICRQPFCESCKGKVNRVAPDSPDINTDPEAQKFLEGFVNQEILVVLVHMPTRMSTSKHLELKNVRNWAEQSVKAFPGENITADQFILVEIRKSGAVRTTSLDKWEDAAPVSTT